MSDFSEVTIRVRYAETDQMGVAYYANYFVWFEIGRTDLCRQLGFTYRQMEEEDGAFLIVADCQCRYLRPTRYDDVLRIRTRVAESRSRSVKFVYEILLDSTGEVVATGESTHVVTDRNGRPRTLPEKYRKYFPLTNQTVRTVNQ